MSLFAFHFTLIPFKKERLNSKLWESFSGNLGHVHSKSVAGSTQGFTTKTQNHLWFAQLQPIKSMSIKENYYLAFLEFQTEAFNISFGFFA